MELLKVFDASGFVDYSKPLYISCDTVARLEIRSKRFITKDNPEILFDVTTKRGEKFMTALTQERMEEFSINEFILRSDEE